MSKEEVKKVECTVLRPFRLDGKRIEPGKKVQLDPHLFGELLAAQKVKKYSEPEKEEKEPKK